MDFGSTLKMVLIPVVAIICGLGLPALIVYLVLRAQQHAARAVLNLQRQVAQRVGVLRRTQGVQRRSIVLRAGVARLPRLPHLAQLRHQRR
ncbi:MAG: hypothetical protein CFE45_38040, partial [Burkholderiales bacterium PBB5]